MCPLTLSGCAGGRWTDRDDLPAEKTAHAMRDLDRLIALAHKHGSNVGWLAPTTARFARDPGEFAVRRLHVVGDEHAVPTRKG
jgi:hypothetical protein